MGILAKRTSSSVAWWHVVQNCGWGQRVKLGPPEGKKTVTAEELEAIMHHSRRVRALKQPPGSVGDNPIP